MGRGSWVVGRGSSIIQSLYFKMLISNLAFQNYFDVWKVVTGAISFLLTVFGLVFLLDWCNRLFV